MYARRKVSVNRTGGGLSLRGKPDGRRGEQGGQENSYVTISNRA